MTEPIKFEDRRDNLYLSDVFRYIEQLGRKGHQIGRKVGDMLEILTLGAIFKKAELKKRCGIEERVVGYSGAGHKVEYVIYELDAKAKKDKEKVLAFLECKKVGVEVSNYGRLKLKEGEVKEYKLSPKWLTNPLNLKFKSKLVKDDEISLTITDGEIVEEEQKVLFENDTASKTFNLKFGDTIKIAILETEDVKILGPTEHLNCITEHINNCRYFTLDRIGEDFGFKIEKCLTGPQTIEKAKQAGLVALDVRRKVDGKWGKEEIEEKDKSFISCLIIGEASHLEEKSRKVIRATIDHNIIVPDKVIVDLITNFRAVFGDEDFLNKINKNEFQKNTHVQTLINNVIKDHKNKIFYDLDTNNFVEFDYKDGKFVVEDIS